MAGVNLPNFEAFQVGLLTYLDSTFVFQINAFDIFHKQDGSDSNELAGLAKGGQQFKRLKVNPTLNLAKTSNYIEISQANYQKAINLLVELASLQTSFITLDEVIKTTNRRCRSSGHN